MQYSYKFLVKISHELLILSRVLLNHSQYYLACTVHEVPYCHTLLFAPQAYLYSYFLPVPVLSPKTSPQRWTPVHAGQWWHLLCRSQKRFLASFCALRFLYPIFIVSSTQTRLYMSRLLLLRQFQKFYRPYFIAHLLILWFRCSQPPTQDPTPALLRFMKYLFETFLAEKLLLPRTEGQLVFLSTHFLRTQLPLSGSLLDPACSSIYTLRPLCLNEALLLCDPYR